ncbi:hypothetical protein Tco_0672843, partial [Tanacetum coccineum]
MHENDFDHKDVTYSKTGEVGTHSEDPFNIYGLLDGQKNKACNSGSEDPKFPPRHQTSMIMKKKDEETIQDTNERETKAENIDLRTIKDLWGNQMFDHVVGPVGCSGELNERRDLWDYLRTLIGRWEGDTVIMGDFNEVRSEHERFGSTFNRQGAIGFNMK